MTQEVGKEAGTAGCRESEKRRTGEGRRVGGRKVFDKEAEDTLWGGA